MSNFSNMLLGFFFFFFGGVCGGRGIRVVREPCLNATHNVNWYTWMKTIIKLFEGNLFFFFFEEIFERNLVGRYSLKYKTPNHDLEAIIKRFDTIIFGAK